MRSNIEFLWTSDIEKKNRKSIYHFRLYLSGICLSNPDTVKAHIRYTFSRWMHCRLYLKIKALALAWSSFNHSSHEKGVLTVTIISQSILEYPWFRMTRLKVVTSKLWISDDCLIPLDSFKSFPLMRSFNKLEINRNQCIIDCWPISLDSCHEFPYLLHSIVDQ